MTRKRQGYVKKRKGFNGVPSYIKKHKIEEEKKEESSGSQKMLEFNQPAHPPETRTGPTHMDPCRNLEGFYLVSGPQLKAALQAAHVCSGGKILVKLHGFTDMFLNIFTLDHGKCFLKL